MKVAKSLKPGRNVVAGWVKNGGAGPNPAGLVGLVKIQFESGEPLVIPTDAAWKTTTKEADAWQGRRGAPTAWQAAQAKES